MEDIPVVNKQQAPSTRSPSP